MLHRLLGRLFFLGAFAGAMALLGCEADKPDSNRVSPSQPEPTLAGLREFDTIPPGMVLIAGSEAQTAFLMDATEVTVAAYDSFVQATGYVTEAEEFGWSGFFDVDTLGWVPVDGATYRYPLGPDEPPAARDEPATQLSFRDVGAYANWVGKAIPTEEEWTYAASQGGRYAEYPWGEEELPGGRYLGNWWQGPFPIRDEVADGFPGVAPIKSYPPTENGLYDIAGNVWEWTASQRPGTGEYVIRGGSFLCSNSYCSGFNLGQRQYTPADSGLNHLGFRCVLR